LDEQEEERIEGAMKIIGIGHKARQGKNSLAAELVKQFGTKDIYAKQYGFADALKSTCRILGMKEKQGSVLQAFGTDVMRAINPSIWLDTLMYTMLEDNPDIAVITDVRFKNEAALVRQYKGLLLKLERYNQSGKRFIVDDRDPNHPSETDLDDYEFDLVIKSTKLSDLYHHAERITQQY
jgi:hypothetical protein